MKIEDHIGRRRTEKIIRVPGIAFAEWGPRDTSYASGHLDVAFDYGRKPDVVEPPPLRAAAQRVMRACKAANVFILDNVRPENVIAQLDAGIMICAGGIREAAEIGRRHTRRMMPWKTADPLSSADRGARRLDSRRLTGSPAKYQYALLPKAYP